MESRSIQRVGGTTFAISLPKQWILKHGLKEKQELQVSEKNDGSLLITPSRQERKALTEITLSIDSYERTIDQVLFTVYYLGVSDITLVSKKPWQVETKSRIRKTLVNMSGTEIVEEDEKRMHIKVLLDKSKLDVTQILYRIQLLIDSSIHHLCAGGRLDDITLNEAEVDRLYHLVSKAVSLSLIDPGILASCGIRHISTLPAFFLLGKRLENIADDIMYAAAYLGGKKPSATALALLPHLSLEYARTVRHLLKKNPGLFEKLEDREIANLNSRARKESDVMVRTYLVELVRYLTDIQEEVVNITFYSALIEEQQI